MKHSPSSKIPLPNPVPQKYGLHSVCVCVCVCVCEAQCRYICVQPTEGHLHGEPHKRSRSIIHRDTLVDGPEATTKERKHINERVMALALSMRITVG